MTKTELDKKTTIDSMRAAIPGKWVWDPDNHVWRHESGTVIKVTSDLETSWDDDSTVQNAVPEPPPGVDEDKA